MVDDYKEFIDKYKTQVDYFNKFKYHSCTVRDIEGQNQNDTFLDYVVKDLVFVGRSNVGKSSLINGILGKNICQTSKTPGKTKELMFIEFEPQLSPEGERDQLRRVVDCPGYGFAKVSSTE